MPPNPRLSNDKFIYFKKQIELDNYSLVFLSETWFINHFTYMSSPVVLTATPLINRKEGRRQIGGIVCLCPPSSRHLIQVMKVTEFTITVKIRDLIVSAVYFPPSMTPEIFSEILDSLSFSNIVLGDFNVRLGIAYGDLVSGPSSRLSILSRFCSSYCFNIVKASPLSETVSRVDHVLVKPSVPVALTVLNSPTLTDHPMIQLSMFNVVSSPSTTFNHFRFNLKFLSHPVTLRSFLELINCHLACLLPMLAYMEISCPLSQDLIDLMDQS